MFMRYNIYHVHLLSLATFAIYQFLQGTADADGSVMQVLDVYAVLSLNLINVFPVG